MTAVLADDACSADTVEHSHVDTLQDTRRTLDQFTAAIRDLHWFQNYREPAISEGVAEEARRTLHKVVTEFITELRDLERPWTSTVEADMYSTQEATANLASVFYGAQSVSPELQDEAAWENLAKRSLASHLEREDFDRLNALARCLGDGIRSQLDGPTIAFT